MNKRTFMFCAAFGLSMFLFTSYSQSLPEFGKISIEDLSNKPYKPDPGADAIVLSDIALAELNHDARDFFVEMVRDVRIRIVNSSGYDYADVAIPYDKNEIISDYKASTFNLKDGVKVETAIPKKNFIIEETSDDEQTLKFNFPDVHEGSVIEYSYRIRLGGYSVYNLVPWVFQRSIPVALSSITIEYPVTFAYKYTLSGTSANIEYGSAKGNKQFLGRYEPTNILTCATANMPAFSEEPYILGTSEHVSRIKFELASAEVAGLYFEISPSYGKLTEKLLDRSDFGSALNTNLKSLANKVTGSESNNLMKLKAIHKYITSNILWNGENDFTTSTALRTVLNKEKGNSADINILLIAMARSAGLSADPVILSTRSNGSLNTFSGMMQQFNYVIARIRIDGETYLVDATDPLRPFSELPYDCLNKTGRLISPYEAIFVDLTNNEKDSVLHRITISPDPDGSLKGRLENTYSGYSAFNLRNLVKLESEEGYLDILKYTSPNSEISDLHLAGLEDAGSDIKETFDFMISDGSQVTGDEIVINPYQMRTAVVNPFFAEERKYPVDFGCARSEAFEMTLKIPEGYHLVTKPEDMTNWLDKASCSFSFSCQQSDNEIKINSLFKINKIAYSPAEYKDIQKFYLKMQKKQSEFLVLKKN